MRPRTPLRALDAVLLLLWVAEWSPSHATARPLIDTVLPLSEIIWRPEGNTEFVGTPSICTLPNGTYLATHDDFGAGGVATRAHVYASHDKGETWAAVATVEGQYWSNLFVCDGDVYLLGTASDGYAGDGSIAISRSSDAGLTWQRQVIVAAPDTATGTYATGATPLLASGGRLWRGFELWASPHRWPQDFQAMLVSAPEDADLMDPASWTATPPLPFDTAWLADVQPSLPSGGYLEGNAVERPDGSVGLLMRMPHLQTQGAYSIDLNHACLLSYQPSHFGPSTATASHGSAGALAAYAAAASDSNATDSNDRDNNAADDTARGLLSAEPMGIQEKGSQKMELAAAGQTSQQPWQRGRIKWHAAQPRTVQRQLMPRLEQQQQQQGPAQQGRPAGSHAGSAGMAATAEAADGTLAYDRIVDMPGGGNKFVVRKDDATGLYIALSNPQTPDANGNDQRNLLELITSPDLVTWTSVMRLLADDTGFQWADSLRYTGFQYVDWQFEGADLICVIRTAYRGANSYHNSNRMTFMRVPDWRSLLPTPGASAPYLRSASSNNPDVSSVAGSSARDGSAAVQPLWKQAAAAERLLKEAAGKFRWGSRCCKLGAACGAC